MATLNRSLAALVLAALAAPAIAGEPVVLLDRHLAAADAARAQADAWQRWADDFSHDMRASMGTLFAPRMASNKVVKGAPYTAEVVTETTQALADGNTISRRKTGLVFRDSEGRTRQELAGDGKNATVHISDPVEGKHLILTPGGKKAIVMPRVKVATAEGRGRHKQVVRVNDTEIRVEDGKVFVDGKEAAPGRVDVTAKSGRKVVVENGKVFVDGKEISVPRTPSEMTAPGEMRHVETIKSADGTTREEVRVHVVRHGDLLAPLPPVPPVPPVPGGPAIAPLPPLPPLPGIGTFRFESTAKLGKGVTTQLGTREFDGVKAEGKSTVWTIPAGEIGNRNPINITSETWFSPELQVTVHSRYHDPRTGESVYRLANIRRVEPAADLFKVPEGYETKERKRERSRG
ncbi:MAG TPA: hypothetical protein VEC19_06205 [Usitatibacter sp.]|nr:hypothetical protein [Usitatibacter sp.]